MGHAEMCLAVAGLSTEVVADTTKRLAGDRRDLPEAERVALALAEKQARDPGSVTDADLRDLERHYGRDGAWHVIWWASRCHYMTKVADAFQLPLEAENPFVKMPGTRKAK